MKTKFNILAAAILLAAGTAGFGQPSITTQPQALTNAVGTTATFWVVATGTPTLAHQWQKLSGTWSDLAGCTDTNLCLTNVQASHAGDYRVVITNVDGAATSDVARLTVIVPPKITPTVSLQHLAADIGTTNSFVVTASGTAPLSFQWRMDGLNLSGQTSNRITFGSVKPSDEGDYTVVVSNLAGSVTSEPARLWVTPCTASPDARTRHIRRFSKELLSKTSVFGASVCGPVRRSLNPRAAQIPETNANPRAHRAALSKPSPPGM